MAKKKWIQEAINPKHKGYCTPMTKSTCTPRRKALAKRFKTGDLSKRQTGGDAPLEDQYDYQVPLNAPQQANNSHVFMGSQTYATSGTDSFNKALQQSEFQNRSKLRNDDNRVIGKYKKMGYDVVPGEDGKVKFMKGKGEWQDNPYTDIFNKGASLATGVGNFLQSGRQRNQERQQINQSMTPKYMQNMEAQGLNNVPAYMEYGGDIIHDRSTYYGEGIHGEGTSYPVKQVSVGQNRDIYSEGVVQPTDRTYEEVPQPTYNKYSGTGRAIKPHYGPGYMFGGHDNTFNRQPVMEYGGWDQEGFMMMYGGMGEGLPYDERDMTNVDYGYQGVHSNNPYGHESIYHTGGNVPKGYHMMPYGELMRNDEMRTGGTVSAEKAKQILKDNSAQGHPLTDKQKRYFGWIAGGSKPRKEYGGWDQEGFMMQTGGYSPEDYYKSSATLAYYKDKLNQKLKAKNPNAYQDYFKGLVAARQTGNPTTAQQYTQQSQYNEYLTPQEVQSTLGKDDYQKYLQALQGVNTYNVQQGQQPLYGNVEGQNDINNLNYGRRFASLQVTPSLGQTVKGAKGDRNYSRNYNYNPQTGNVDFTESGDVSLRPQGFAAPGTRQYGGWDQEGFMFQTGGEAFTPQEQGIVEQYKKQGYDVSKSGGKLQFKKTGTSQIPAIGSQNQQNTQQQKTFDPEILKEKYKSNPYLVGKDNKADNRYFWATQTDREFPLTGGNVKDAVTEAAKLNNIDPSLLYSSAMEEGMSGAIDDKNWENASEEYVDWSKKNPQIAQEYPVDGYYNYGLDQFPGVAKTLEQKGYLPKGFSDQYTTFTAENEKYKKIKTAAFKTDADALKAKSAMMRLAKDQLGNYAKKQGIELTPAQEQFFMLANYNGGEGNMQDMLKSYKDKGYLKNPKFLKDISFKPASYDQIYQNVMRRLEASKMMKNEGVFEYGGKVDYMEYGGECDDCGKKVKFKNGGAASYSHDPRKVPYYQDGGYGIGDEVDLSPEQIAQLRKAGYQIEEI